MDARVVVAKALAADKFAAWCAELPPGCLVALEACGGAHHWARKLRGYGLDARLIAGHFVTPYRMAGKGRKNGAADAAAICEAATRPHMRFVPVTRGASDLGLTVGSLGFFPAMDVVRQALPMVLTMLKMALVICIPLVLLIGTYDLKTVVTVSCVQFALFFVDFWFHLARWIDSTILDALYGWGFGADRPHTNFDPLIGLNNAFGDMLLNFVMAMMFIVLPGFWVAALAWVGVRVGNISQMLSAATDGAKSAGGKGADLAIKAAKAK